MQQGAVHISMPECEVRVRHAESPVPHVFLTTETQDESAAHTLVSELMIMANEAVARIGACHPFYRTPAVVHNPDDLWFIVVAENAEFVYSVSIQCLFSVYHWLLPTKPLQLPCSPLTGLHSALAPQPCHASSTSQSQSCPTPKVLCGSHDCILSCNMASKEFCSAWQGCSKNITELEQMLRLGINPRPQGNRKVYPVQDGI